MSRLEYGNERSFEMSAEGFLYQQKREIDETSFLGQRIKTVGMGYPFSNEMNGGDSNLSGYNNVGQFQNGSDRAALGSVGTGGLNSMAMPRVVDWSDACLRGQGMSSLGRAGPDDGSSLGGPITASSGFMSTKNYASHTFDSSLDTSNQKVNYSDDSPMGDTGELVKSLTLQLQMKETQNESLEGEIQKLRGSFNEALSFKQSEYKFDRQNSHGEKVALEVPQNAEQIVKRLSSSLRSKDNELMETKSALESILTALALDPTNSVTKYGRYDAEALAHKMVTRIETLTKENQEMAKMLAYGRAKEMQIQLLLSQMKNKELTKMISETQGSVDAQEP